MLGVEAVPVARANTGRLGVAKEGVDGADVCPLGPSAHVVVASACEGLRGGTNEGSWSIESDWVRGVRTWRLLRAVPCGVVIIEAGGLPGIALLSARDSCWVCAPGATPLPPSPPRDDKGLFSICSGPPSPAIEAEARLVQLELFIGLNG